MATKRIEARTRIKQHIKERGKDGIEVTPTFVLYWWHLLNHAIFGGILTPPKKIHCRNFRDNCFGWCNLLSGHAVELGIRRELTDRKLFITVLVHEMVHQHEWEINHDIPRHGKSFLTWAPLIKRTLNLPLSQFIDDE